MRQASFFLNLAFLEGPSTSLFSITSSKDYFSMQKRGLRVACVIFMFKYIFSVIYGRQKIKHTKNALY